MSQFRSYLPIVLTQREEYRVWDCLMTKQDDYLQSAADAMGLVRRAPSNEDKGRLLKLAQAWVDLADRARRAARRIRRPNLAEPLEPNKLERHPD
jgi:hypothetical protein